MRFPLVLSEALPEMYHHGQDDGHNQVRGDADEDADNAHDKLHAERRAAVSSGPAPGRLGAHRVHPQEAHRAHRGARHQLRHTHKHPSQDAKITLGVR